jgi:hypothetical protein
MRVRTHLGQSAWRVTRALVVGCAVLAAAGCKVKLIDDYNKAAEDGLITAYAKVERLFDAIADAPTAQPQPRAYVNFAKQYSDASEAISVQVLRESARPLNAESYGIIAQIDTVFAGYREAHKKANDVPDILIVRHRDVMRRMFGAALRAERVKQDVP